MGVQRLWSAFITSKPLCGKRILLVDDKDLHVYLETKLLNNERAITTRFRDGIDLVEAVDQLMRDRPNFGWPWDAVVLDQTMERLNGLPALEQVRCEFKQAVPIVIYSTEDGLVENYLAAGAVTYMEKKAGSHKHLVARLHEIVLARNTTGNVGEPHTT